MQNENNCFNCRFFAQYYTKHFIYLEAQNCGFCLKRRTLSCEKHNYFKNEVCSKWETKEIQLAQRRARIDDTLHQIARRLEAIARILKSDEEEKKAHIADMVGTNTPDT